MSESINDESYDRYTSDFDQYLLQTWGFIPSDPLDSISICNLNLAFKKITSIIGIELFANLPEQLRNAGVLIRSAIAVDINGDGQEEWVILTHTPGDDAPINLWVLPKSSNNIVPIPVVPWERKQFDLPQNDADLINLNIDTTATPEGTIVAFLRTGGYLYAFEFDSTEQRLDHKLWVVDSVENYVIHQNNNLHLEITTNNEYCEFCKKTYIWSSDNFISTDFISKLPEAETTLFKNADPGEAISQLQEIIIGASDYDYPHLLYLLGLAYELKGEDGNAVKTYWKLWHEFPQSLYARLAQAKPETK